MCIYYPKLTKPQANKGDKRGNKPIITKGKRSEGVHQWMKDTTNF